MLYLVRKSGESVVINNEIEVKVMSIKGNSVKIGFEFPSDCSVLRKEVFDKVAEENKAALTLDFTFDDNDPPETESA